MSEFKKGDRVRFTGEGIVRCVDTASRGDLDVENEAGEFVGWLVPDVDGVTVEKVEPPVEVFKPGDVVRQKHGGSIRALGKHGWTNLTTGAVVSNVSDVVSGTFTSKDYEKVTLG